MTSALAHRLGRLEQARKAREPRKSLVLIGSASDVDLRYQAAVVEGRYRPGEPLMRVLLADPLMNVNVRSTP
jgi:hypothetical protein